MNAIVGQFSYESLVWYSVESATKVKDTNVSLDLVVIITHEVVYCDKELSFTRVSLSESMLEGCERVVLICEAQDMGADYMFQEFTGYACKRDWPTTLRV